MAFIRNKLSTFPHITVPTGTAQSLGQLLGLSPTNRSETRVSTLVLRAHPENSDLLYVGETDVAANKCIPMSAAEPLEINVDDTDSDEDISFIDLFDVFVLAPVPDQILCLVHLKVVEVDYKG